MSSGIRRPGRPVRPPADAETAQWLEEWLASPDHAFNAVGMDFRGADLSRMDFTEAWLSSGVFTSVSMRGIDLHRAHLGSADLTDADLTGAGLTKVTLDDARLHRARFDGADFASASLWGVDAQGASFRGARFPGAAIMDADLRGASLADAVFEATGFRVTLDDRSVVEGLSGSLFGPVTVVDAAGKRELAGAALAEWLAARGANVQVAEPSNRS